MVGSGVGVGSVVGVGVGVAEPEPSAGAVLLGGGAAAAVPVGVVLGSEVAAWGGDDRSPDGVDWAERLGRALWRTSELVSFAWWEPGHARAVPAAAAAQATRATTGRNRRRTNGFLCLACVPRTNGGCSPVFALAPSAGPAPMDSQPTDPKPTVAASANPGSANPGSAGQDSPGPD